MGNPKGNIKNLTNMGKGRPKGSRNKTTVAREEGFQTGYWKAIEDLTNGINPKGNGKDKEKSNSILDELIPGISARARLAGAAAPLLGGIGTTSGIVAAIISLWIAEENLKIPIKRDDEIIYIPFPPILHTIVNILTNILLLISGHKTTKEVVESLGLNRSIQTTNELPYSLFNINLKVASWLAAQLIKYQPQLKNDIQDHKDQDQKVGGSPPGVNVT